MSDQISHYVIMPVNKPKPGEFAIMNASIGICLLCGDMATGMGGSDNQICKPCGAAVLAGEAVGAIGWEEAND